MDRIIFLLVGHNVSWSAGVSGRPTYPSSSQSHMKKILFICSANVGRSQMAEGYYNSLVEKGGSLSAGIENVASKYHGKPSEEVIAVMKEDGIDLSQHFIKQVNKEMLRKIKMIVVLCRKSECPDYIQEFPHVKYFFVKDPYREDKNEIIEIRNCIKELILNDI